MIRHSVVLIEAEVIVRHALAEYLRECGFHVLEAVNAEEAHEIIDSKGTAVDALLASLDVGSDKVFALARWVRTNRPDIEVVLAGSIPMTVEKAGDLCQDGPALRKPYDHRTVLDQIRRQLAARSR